jgi:hypothetical protein
LLSFSRCIAGKGPGWLALLRFTFSLASLADSSNPPAIVPPRGWYEFSSPLHTLWLPCWWVTGLRSLPPTWPLITHAFGPGVDRGIDCSGSGAFFLIELTSENFLGSGQGRAGRTSSVHWRTFSNKDQFGLPVYRGLILNGSAVAFLIGLLVYRNRAPLALTLGLFALMPLHSIMTHWSDNEQRGHWFGYWFGHDMFTPPFNGTDGKR